MYLTLKSSLQFCSRIVIFFISLAALSSQASAKDGTDLAPDMTPWRMVWVEDFSAADHIHSDLSDIDLKPYLKDFIRSVNIRTAIIDGQLMTVRASAGCNGIGQYKRKRVVTPAQTIEFIRNGQVHYETIPATYETYYERSTTQTGCSYGQKIEGKLYEFNWIASMERFLISGMRKSQHRLTGNKLEWVDEAGAVIARFEKLPDISMHRHFWTLDPERHENDSSLSSFYGAPQISLNFPIFSSNRGCERLATSFEITESALHFPKKVRSYPCQDFFTLVNGQKTPYISNKYASQNVLERNLPLVRKYKIIQEGEAKRLVMLDQEGQALLHLISTDKSPRRPQELQLKTYDKIDDHDWIMEQTSGLDIETIKAASPFKIVRHHGHSAYQKKEGPKDHASIISAQNCAISGLNVNAQNHRMNVYEASHSQHSFDECEGENVSKLKTEWMKAQNILFDENNLIFYDSEWNEVMRARRGAPLENR